MVKIEEAKAFLNQVYKAKQVCLRCNADLEELRNTSSLLVVAYNEHIDSGNKKHDTSDFICKLQQQEQELERLKLEWLNKRIEVKRFLNNINVSENIRNVLVLRYVSLLKWEEIAVKLNKSYGWVHRLKYKGLEIVAKNLKSSI